MVNNYGKHIFVEYFLMFLLFDIKVINSHGLDKYLIDFDTAMNTKNIKYYKKYGQGQNKEIIAKLKALYECNHFSKLQRSQEPKIPKIIHQIWVGPKPVPTLLKASARGWKKSHPDWQYILWTNDMVERLLPEFLPEHKDMYLNDQSDVREKANILRYYLLYWYGGLYVDADCQCLTSFEELHYYYDFYAGITTNSSGGVLNNAVIGSALGHPIMKYVIDTIKNKPGLCFFRSGCMHFSDKVCEVVDTFTGVNIVFPVNVFYPDPRKLNFSKNDLIHSMCLHYWVSLGCLAWEDDICE